VSTKNRIIHNYKTLRHSLQSFDIICCEHKDLFWNLVGHSAMIVVDNEKDIVWIWQSSTQYANVSGTSLMPFNEWLTQYPGHVAIRQISMPMSLRRTAEERLDAYIAKYRGKPYPNLKSLTGWKYMYNQIADIMPWTENHPDPDGDARDCSDRIVHTLKTCGILNQMINPSEQEPDNLRENVLFHTPIDVYTERGVVISKEIWIK